MITARLQGAFKIYPGEGRMTALVLGYAILLFSSNVLAMTASLGLFFGTYDAATLPYTYVLLMFIGPLVSLVYLRFNSTFTFSKVLLGVHAFMLIALILLPLILNRSTTPLLRFSLPVYLEVNVTLTYTSFWNLLGRIYHLRQGKRLFPLLSSGEHLATIGAGFFATLFVTRFGTADLYWVGALCMAGAIALLVAISRANSSKMENSADREGKVTNSAFNLGALAREPYVRLLFAMVALYTISIMMIENLTYTQAEIRFPTADGMATYVGLFMGIYGVLGLLVQWLIAGRTLDRFGAAAVVLAMPGGLFIIMAIFALAGSFNAATILLFWLSSGANMYAYILDAPYIAARNVMLQPLPAYLRTQAQTIATGIAYPLATGISGLLLLFMINILGFESAQISYAILIVLALWAIVVYQFGRVYVQRLRQVLLARAGLRSDPDGPGLLHATDHATISVLQEALCATAAPNPTTALYALNMLAELAPEVLPGHLPELLAYPDAKVRAAALDYMAGISQNGTLPIIERSAIDVALNGDSSPEVRAAALRVWYVMNSPSADSGQAPSASPVAGGENSASEAHIIAEHLAAYARDPQMPVRRSALAIMISHKDPAVRRQAWEMLNEIAHSVKPGDRIMAAGVIEEMAEGEIEKGDRSDRALLALLRDREPRVQRAALAAAVRTRSPDVWAAIIRALGQRSTCSLAANALSAGGEDVLPLLLAASQEVDQDPWIVAGIAQVCGRIGVPEAVGILKSLAAHPDANVRRQAVLGLSRCSYQAEAEERSAVKERFHLLAAALARIIAAQVDIGDDAPVRLTADALEQRRDIGTDNLLLLLSFLEEVETVLSAREALRTGRDEEQKRAYALEMLDILLDHEMKAMLFPFVQQLEPQRRLAELQKQFPQKLLGRRQRLYTLLAGARRNGAYLDGERDRWTQICAIYALGLLHDRADEMKEGVGVAPAKMASTKTASAVQETAVRFGDDPVLVETALFSLEELGVSLESVTDPGLKESLECWRARDPQAMSLLQKVDALKKAGILADLPGETLEAVAALLEVVTAGAGETIIHMGDPGDCMYIVIDGRLRVHAGGHEFDAVGAGAVIGEMALLDTEPRSASVTAVTQSRLLRLDQDLFYNLLDGNPQVTRELLHLLSTRLRERTADVILQTGREATQPVQPMMRGHMGRVHNTPYTQGAPVQGELTALDRLLLLKDVDFFSGIDDDLLGQVALLLEEVDLVCSEHLFEQGDAGHSLYIIAVGQVRIHIEEQTLAYAGEGEVIGEMALLELEPRLATVTAVAPTLLLRLDQQPFFELLEAQPNLSYGMIKTLSRRLRGRLQELAEGPG